MFLETGTVLNNIYRVIKLLGKGAMGNVYLVERIKDDKKFVVKELVFSEEGPVDTGTAKEIFFREAEFMAQFNYHGLPGMHGIFSQNGREYLTMDYIEGKTLEEIINSLEKPLTEEQAINLTVKIAEILDYLHNAFHAPVVYRDLKPSNIIITPKGEPKLVDFGIARYYNPDKDTDTFKYGSPGYAAPEQYKGRGQSTPLSDIYGLGVILYQMLTKHDPTLKLFHFPPLRNLNSSVSDKLEAIVKHAMELDPLNRYISMEEFKETLEKYTGSYHKKAKKVKTKNIYEKLGTLIGGISIFSPFMIIVLMNIFKNYIPETINSVKLMFIVMLLLPLSGLILSIAGSVKSREEKNSLSLSTIGGNLLVLVFVFFLGAIFIPGFIGANTQRKMAECESNIKNIALSVETYAMDNGGNYPSSLDYLTKCMTVDKKAYMKTLPLCPSCRIPYKYTCATGPDNFTLMCGKANAHISVGQEGDYPQYTQGQGLILKYMTNSGHN